MSGFGTSTTCWLLGGCLVTAWLRSSCAAPGRPLWPRHPHPPQTATWESSENQVPETEVYLFWFTWIPGPGPGPALSLEHGFLDPEERWVEETWPVISLSVCGPQPSTCREAESHGKAATCPRSITRQGGKPEWPEAGSIPSQASPPSLGLPGPGLASALGQAELFCSDNSSMPSLHLCYLRGLNPAMAPKPELNTCSNPSPTSAPVCQEPPAPARKLSPHLPCAPRAGSLPSFPF